MIGDFGRFNFALPHMFSDKVFDDFKVIIECIFNKTGEIHLKTLFELISQAVEALFLKNIN